MLGVLGLGAGALLMDQVVLESGHTGPYRAAAEGIAQRVAANSGVSDQAQGLMQTMMALLSEPGDGPMLSDHLSSTAEAYDVSPLNPRDAFTASGAWALSDEPTHRPQAQETAAAAASESENDSDDPLRRFKRQYRLQAVMADGSRGIAIVNDRALRVGQQIDGFTLERVGNRTAMFRFGERAVQLEVSDDH